MQNYIAAVCGSTMYFLLFLVLTILYKFVLHIIGFVLIFLTRKVEVDVLNDSKYIPTTLYCATFVLIATCIILPIVSDNRNLDDSIWALIVFINVSVFLGFNFIPKVNSIHVWQNMIIMVLDDCSVQRSRR